MKNQRLTEKLSENRTETGESEGQAGIRGTGNQRDRFLIPHAIKIIVSRF